MENGSIVNTNLVDYTANLFGKLYSRSLILPSQRQRNNPPPPTTHPNHDLFEKRCSNRITMTLENLWKRDVNSTTAITDQFCGAAGGIWPAIQALVTFYATNIFAH